MFTIFFVCFGFALLCVLGVTAGDFFHNTMSASDQAARDKRVLNMITQARYDLTHNIGDENMGRESEESRASYKSQTKRQLSALNRDSHGDIFPSPYSIKDPRMIELMRKINMNVFDEELEVRLLCENL